MTRNDLFFFLCEFLMDAVLLAVMWAVLVFICCLSDSEVFMNL